MGVPQPIQARAESTVSAVITATVRAIEEGGESNVRIDEILVETGISKGSLYHHFGGREGLIAAARVVQFSRFIESDAQQIHEALTAATTLDEYVAAASHLLEVGEGVERQKIRLARLNTISSSYGRSDLWNALSVQQHAHTEVIDSAETWARRFPELLSQPGPTFVELMVEQVPPRTGPGFELPEMPDLQFSRMGQELAALQRWLETTA